MKFKDVGLMVYNYNLDTSSEYYDKVISSRKYEDWLNMIVVVCEVGIFVCCGGIFGLGEEELDWVSLMMVLATFFEYSESVFINALVFVEGMLFKDMILFSGFEMVCVIVVVCILMFVIVVWLSVGCVNMSSET